MKIQYIFLLIAEWLAAHCHESIPIFLSRNLSPLRRKLGLMPVDQGVLDAVAGVDRDLICPHCLRHNFANAHGARSHSGMCRNSDLSSLKRRVNIAKDHDSTEAKPQLMELLVV